jgi:hypothetical protein
VCHVVLKPSGLVINTATRSCEYPYKYKEVLDNVRWLMLIVIVIVIELVATLTLSLRLACVVGGGGSSRYT